MSNLIQPLVKYLGARALYTQGGVKIPIKDVMTEIDNSVEFEEDIMKCEALMNSAVVRLQSIIPRVINSIDYETADPVADPNMSRFLTRVNAALATLDQEQLLKTQTKFCDMVSVFPNRTVGYTGYMIARSESLLRNVKTSYSAMYIDLLYIFAQINPYPIHNKRHKLAFNECVNTIIRGLINMDQEVLCSNYFEILSEAALGNMTMPIDIITQVSRDFSKINVVGIDMSNFMSNA